MAELTHASFFSGAGGMDIGLESAGWKTVSFSEIDDYACAVLRERWPHVPNIGDITKIIQGSELLQPEWERVVPITAPVPPRRGQSDPGYGSEDRGSVLRSLGRARLWTGGFPCQDLSIAGRRRGIYAERSGLAWAFLDLVERCRPEAFILENVPGLLSSNGGRDFGQLLREVGDLGYGWAYRVLDAQWFGVPQRRRRVFVLALDLARHPDPNSAGMILAIGTSCRRNHFEERATWSQVAREADNSSQDQSDHQAPDSDRGRATHGLAGQPHSGLELQDAPRVADAHEAEAQEVFVKSKRAMTKDDYETWTMGEVSPTLNLFDTGDIRATTLVKSSPLISELGVTSALTRAYGRNGLDENRVQAGLYAMATQVSDDGSMPQRLDANRFRVTGNGVAAPVAEWLGRRLANYLRGR